MSRWCYWVMCVWGLLLVLRTPPTVLGQFSIVPTTVAAPFNGRFGATLISLPYSLTYQNWTYVVNATAPCTGASLQCLNPPYIQATATTPNNSLFLFGGFCGHAANALSVLGDPDVWTSPDGGITWNFFGGAHGLSGSAQIYVAALSGSTPYWQGSNPAVYPTPLAGANTYGIYPGSVGVHDNIHQRFHILGGDYYYGSGVWKPTSFVQNSGGAYSLNSTITGAPLNLEGQGWTNLCLDPIGGISYSFCDSFSVRTSAASTSDSRGNLYLLNGVAAYDSNNFPWILQGDVWMSSNGALTWTQMAPATPWSTLGNGGRMESAATSFYSTNYNADVIYNIGGCGTSSSGFNVAGSTLIEVPYNDVYVSINQGASWYTVTSTAAFSPRCGLTAVVSTGGVLVIVGGRSAQSYTASGAGWPTYYTVTLGLTTLPDVWTSMDGGIQWYQLSATGGRDRAAISLDINGFLHIVGGKAGLGSGYSTVACPKDAYVSSQSFNTITSWITSVVAGATIPAATGLHVAAVSSSVGAVNPFNMTTLNGGAGFNGRAGAGLIVLPNSITFKTWTYFINATYPTATFSNTNPLGITNATANAAQYTMTTPANSLFLFGGECGHGQTASASVGDPDVWTSTDGGFSWYLVGGAHGLDLDSNTGTFGAYVSALSANTPFWQGSNPATYPAVSAPQSYSTYPGAIPLHDNVNHKFYLLGGELYGNSAHWVPTNLDQSSGAPSASLQQLSTVSGAPINPEAIGWTNQCLNITSGSYRSCSAAAFPARSFAGGCVDSSGNLYVMNGISAYDFVNQFPQTLLADVWMSSNQGLTWAQPTLTVPWGAAQGRQESSSVSYFSSFYSADVIYNIGGCTSSSAGYGVTASTLVESGFNDVYASINQGVTWYNISLAAAWPARCGMAVAVTSTGVMALVGGRKPQSYLTTAFPAYYEGVLGYYTLTDIWTSLDGGVTWLQLTTTGGRDRPALVFDANGYLRVVSGRVTAGVYYFTPSACPSDSLMSSLSFNTISTWITTIPGLSSANVPSGLGLRSIVPGGPPVSSSTGTGVALATASLCYLVYGLSGNVDYPWSAALNLTFQYNPNPITTASGTGFTIVSGTGTRTYTNRFGATTLTSVTVSSSPSDNVLYTNQAMPVDSSGLSLSFPSPIQLPGGGPTNLFSGVTLRSVTGSSTTFIAEGSSSRIDGAGEAFASTVPGFVPLTIGAANVNALAVLYSSCQAPITFTNGLRQPTQPSASNGALHLLYSYYLSDGATFTVQTNLSITTSSQFASTRDFLGNPYQTITGITGTRTYTYLPTSTVVQSTVTFTGTGSNRFYPYALLASAPGVYSINTAPFIDADGLTFSISPSASALGAAPGSGTQSSSIQVQVVTNNNVITQLNEAAYVILPSYTLQQQGYLLQ